jgi:hypothetical protein
LKDQFCEWRIASSEWKRFSVRYWRLIIRFCFVLPFAGLVAFAR